MALTITSLILDAGVVAPGTSPFPYFAAAQNGLTSALCVCLLINGFVGFQLYEDGTTLSVWLLRLCSLGMFMISGAVSLLTFKGWAGLGPTRTIGLFVVLYIFSGIFLVVYFGMQVFLVVNTLQDRWPLGDLVFGAFFFIVGQVILYALSDSICESVNHYLDGLFFATICNLLAVMMIYKVGFHVTGVETNANSLRSTGIPSREKTSSSVSAQSSTTGRSRNSSQKTIGERQCTQTPPSTPAAMCITNKDSNALPPMTATLTDLCTKSYRLDCLLNGIIVRRWMVHTFLLGGLHDCVLTA